MRIDKCVTEHRNCSAEALLKMSYAEHETLACKWGVELIGWTEPEIVNPSKLTTSHALTRLLMALRNEDCHWNALDLC